MKSKKFNINEERKFGILVIVILSLLYIYDPNKYINKNIILVFLVLLVLITVFLSKILIYPRKIWIKLGFLLHNLTNPLILSII
jgi:cell division protein FtsW (lipid II flippase)